ncbi:putative 2-dehydropantoate 2-reductase [Teratosphaeria nubilosa]|uniref:2-dehydropantoate 2-reductase n=1 Tax=Teratosphaeria nubilosa TaxID=161662 RepID=A0A6G1L4F1_9PEZI|nr:putative 2-dehydropantoate 2-reductase [Teratosphaeria nubilosa]
MGSASKTRILLIGSGAVGTMAAYALEAGGQAEVTAVLRSNFDVVTRQGFSIDSIDHGRGITGFRPSHIRKTIPHVTEEHLPPFEYVFVSTKNVPDVHPNVLDIIAPAVTPGHSSIVLFQNGLNLEKPIIEHFPDNVVLSGISLIGANETSHGHIKHDEPDVNKIGPFPNQSVPAEQAEASAKDFVNIYSACGKVDCQYDDDVAFTRWRKLVYNSSYNVVAAIIGMDVIRMRMSRIVIDDLVLPAMKEIRATAKAAGVDLPEGLEQKFITIDSHEGWFMPSMGQDMLKGNFVEMENIVGEPVREAERLGVQTPVLKTCYGILRGLQLRTKEARGLWKPEFEKDNPYQ